MKKVIIIFWLITPFILSGQHNIAFSFERGYWQHTDLWGVQGGLEYSLKLKNNWRIHFGAGFGYGEKNRLEDFPANPENKTTLKVGFASSYIIEYGFERTQTDNAKQFMLNIGFSYEHNINPKQKLFFQTNIFGQKVNHFYVIDKLGPGYDVNYGFYFIGPLDVYIVSQQSFYTIGLEQKIGYSFEVKENKYIMPYITGGYGYNQTSFFGFGISAGGVL